MFRLIPTILFYVLILFPNISIAEEIDTEHVMVPETSESISDTPTEDNAQNEEAEMALSEETESVSDDVPLLENKTEETYKQETDKEESTEATETHTETPQEDPVAEKDAPSQDEIEARQAEEAEIREAGAGEEPPIEE